MIFPDTAKHASFDILGEMIKRFKKAVRDHEVNPRPQNEGKV
jgi:hypothetical protein